LSDFRELNSPCPEHHEAAISSMADSLEHLWIPKAGGVTQVVEHLPSTLKALGSITSTTKQNNNKMKQTNKSQKESGAVAHACNHNYLGG
jgi:hypothetical protein